jgi:hypothetical protein
MYKEADLFGGESLRMLYSAAKKRNLFSDYDGFVEKFEPKKTTDDCYTPQEVFDLVLQYVGKNCDLSGKKIIRPFYPGGAFEALEYPADGVVIDNPPFSILSKIVRFYTKKKIPFFLFAPHLTLFSCSHDCTAIVVCADIRYDNGAVVKTSFVSNMFGEAKVIGDAELCQEFKKLAANQKANLPKYNYSDHVLTVSAVAWCVEKGISVRFDQKDLVFVRGLDSQKVHGKTIFGAGFLLSEKAAAEKVNIITWELSERELQIIRSLG